MESFRTIIPIKPASFQIAHSNPVFLMGSCFTEHIGERLAGSKFSTCLNPNGIVYNPVSIARSLGRLLDGKQEYVPSDLVQINELWHSWEHHGLFSKPELTETLEAINHSYHEAAGFFDKCRRLVLTLGTATVYELTSTGQVVANCHKSPATTFRKRRLSVAEITGALYPALSALLQAHSEMEIILTVSPVRHLRDGAVENQRSKAALVLACAELENSFSAVHYFPAYEIVLDELRDYRFYNPDMLHPNSVAVDYVWSKFCETYFSPETRALLERIEKIKLAAAHRPFNPATPAHQKFIQSQIEAIINLKKAHPALDFSPELAIFGEQTQATG